MTTETTDIARIEPTGKDQEWRAFQHWFIHATEACDRNSAWEGWQANAARRQLGGGEEMMRFCPECGLLGDVPDNVRDCCPDGSHARIVPKRFAEICRETFRMAVGEPSAAAASEGREAFIDHVAHTSKAPLGFTDHEASAWSVGVEDGIVAALRQDAFQRRVHPWMIECFGTAITADRIERNHRFFEEATECVQANGMTRSEAHQLVNYTFDRPVGELRQEVGGVMVTLAALCIASDVDMHEAADVELARVWQKIEQIRAKQAAKPKHSPLPEHVPAPYPAHGEPGTLEQGDAL